MRKPRRNGVFVNFPTTQARPPLKCLMTQSVNARGQGESQVTHDLSLSR